MRIKFYKTKRRIPKEILTEILFRHGSENGLARPALKNDYVYNIAIGFEKNQIVGWSGIIRYEFKWFFQKDVVSCYVQDQFRKNGYGSRLVERTLRDQKNTTLWYFTYTSKNFYKSINCKAKLIDGTEYSG